MILTIDLNPAIEKRYIVDNISIGDNIKASSFTYNLSGKGIKVEKLLNIFNENSFLTGFLGGINGEYFHMKLKDAGIPHEFVGIKEDIRTIVKLKDISENYINIMEEAPRITREELTKFYNLSSGLMENMDIICGLGSTFHPSVPKDIYFDLITLANKKRKKFILDGTEDKTRYGIDASPYMVVLNKRELEGLMNVTLDFENQIIKSGQYILDRGVGFVIIDLQEKGSIVLGQDKGYRVEIPNYECELGTDHSGMIAGFALGINRNYDLDMTMKLGQSFSIVSNMDSNLETTEISDIKRIMGQIDIYSINY